MKPQEVLVKLALKNIHGIKCANCLQQELSIKKFKLVDDWEAEVTYACPNPECNDIEFHEVIVNEEYFPD